MILRPGTVMITEDSIVVRDFHIGPGPDGSKPSGREAVEWARDRLNVVLDEGFIDKTTHLELAE